MTTATRPLYPRASARAVPVVPSADPPRLARAASVLLAPTVAALLLAAFDLVSFRVALAVPLALGTAAIVLGWRRPSLAVLGIVLLCVLDSPMRVFLLNGAPLPWNTLNYLLLASIGVQVPRLLRLNDPQSWLLGALVALLAVELLIGDDVTAGAQHTLGAVASFGILLALIRAGGQPEVYRWLAIIAGVVGAVGGLAFYLDGRQIGGINPNAWSLAPLTALVGIAVGIGSARATRLVLLPLAAANLGWVFLSGSRGSLLVALCCVLYLLWSMGGAGGRLATLVVIVTATTLLAVRFPELTANTLHRVRKTFESEEANARQVSLSERTSGRSDLLLGGWYIFQEHPLGVGTGGFARAWQELGPREGLSEFGRGQRKNAHAGWMLTLAENGLPGILLLAAWVLSFARDGLRTRDRRARGLALLACVGIGVHLIFVEFQSKALWLLAAAATAALHHATPTSGARRWQVAGASEDDDEPTDAGAADGW